MSLELKDAIAKLKAGAKLKFLLVKQGNEPVLLLELGKPKPPKGAVKIAEGFAEYDLPSKSIVLVTPRDADAEKQGIKALKEAGLVSQKLVARKPVEGEEGASEGAPPVEETAPPTQGPSGLLGEILALRPQLDEALKSGRGKPELMTKYYDKAKSGAETGDEAGARKALTLVTALIANALSAGETAEAPVAQPDAPTEPPVEFSADELLKKLLAQIAALKPDVEHTIAVLPEQGAALGKFYERSQRHAEEGETAKAQKELELVQGLLDNARQPTWLKDSEETVSRLDAARKDGLGDIERMTLLWEMAQGKAEVGDYPKAYGLLSKLKRELDAAQPKAGVDGETPAAGNVERLAGILQDALNTWKSALALAQAKMSKAQASILGDENFKKLDEAQWKDIQSGARAMDVSLKAFNTGLDALLAEAERADDPEASKQQARAKVVEYRKLVKSNQLFPAIDKAYDLGLGSTIEAALAKVESMLAR